MLIKAFLVWVLIAVAEVINGILRVRLLNRRVGDHRARQMGVFTGSAILLAIAWLLTPWIRPSSASQALGVGFMWLVLMLASKIGFGRLVFRASWDRIAGDFDFRKGGLLSIGMGVLFLAPFLTAKLRGLT